MIELNNVSYIYSPDAPFEKTALSDVNLKIEQGEFVGIIGHTGSGKSTLVQMMNALLMPSSGTVCVDGSVTNSKDADLRALRGVVGLVFQYPEHQLFEETIEKEIEFGPKNQGVDGAELAERVKWAMDKVNISAEWKDKSPFELSGGQKRRVAIAGVLSMKPEVLILDEPTAGLDPRAKNGLLREICDMHKSLGITVIMVSHNMEDVASIADRIIVMDKGRVRFDDKPSEVFKHIDELEKIGLDVPQVTRLTHKLGLPLCFTVGQAEKTIKKFLTEN